MSKPQNPESDLPTGTPASPDCHTLTRAGDFSVGQTMTGTLIAGMALPDLFFTARGKSIWNREVVDVEGHSGWLCPKCGFVMIRGQVASKVEQDLRNREAVTKDWQPARGG